MESNDTTVLVTGASGFIALHVVAALLGAGFRVRGTVRGEARAAQVRQALTAQGARIDDLQLVEADLTENAGWDEAARDCRYVQHIASPLPRTLPKNEDELIVPAREGTLRVLRAASEAGVERVVMTSSVAAVLYGHERDGSEVYDESCWSNLTPEVGPYEKSKTIAERAAWELVEELPEGKRFDFVTVNPSLVLGPVLGQDSGTSGELVRKLMNREFPGCPKVGWAMVDVRDVAEAHVRAMTHPDAAGKRFICSGGYATIQDVAKILERHFSSRGYRVPTRLLPDFLVRVAAVFDPTTRLVLQEMGKRQDVTSARLRDVLGVTPRPLEDTVVAMAESMIELGILPARAA